MLRFDYEKISLSTTIALALAAGSVNAANYSVDGRGDAMGGVGVVSADFLSAPFYNPSLAALYRRDDNAGMIIPGVGLTYTDNGKMLQDIKTRLTQLMLVTQPKSYLFTTNSLATK